MISTATGNISWDSHTIRDKLAYDPSSKLLTGYAKDAFDSDIIVEKFKQMQDAKAKDNEGYDELNTDGNISDKKSKLNELALGKHYIVFYFNKWTGKGRPVCFMAARFCLHGLLAHWLVMAIQHLISTLALYHGG